jgi:hypothetical protein
MIHEFTQLFQKSVSSVGFLKADNSNGMYFQIDSVLRIFNFEKTESSGIANNLRKANQFIIILKYNFR